LGVSGKSVFTGPHPSKGDLMNKKLLVFCEGTWNEPDKNPTNMAKLFEATCQSDANGTVQIVHYIQGVGTHWYDRAISGAFGWGISENIKDGYKFLYSNYEPGDDIYLFGFSRFGIQLVP
jgi:uncharacterized protein (DUF2235 family)